jgi:hypothetical protein
MGSKHSIGLVFRILCVLAACGSYAAYGAPPTDACSLLTPAQVSAVLGAEVEADHQVAAKACQWSAPDQPTPNAKKVTVILQDERAFAYAKMPVGHGITKTPVSGMGDDAVYGTTPRLGCGFNRQEGEPGVCRSPLRFPARSGR